MQTVLVMRQLTSVLDVLLLQVTREFGLTPHDVLVLAWMVEKPGLAASEIAYCRGRSRQSVQRALVRLERRSLAERYGSSVHDRTAGWGLTQQGCDAWDQLARTLHRQDEALLRRGVVTRPFLDGLKNLVSGLMGASQGMSRVGLLELPRTDEVPEWDL